jgi:cation:H+ antiporter
MLVRDVPMQKDGFERMTWMILIAVVLLLLSIWFMVEGAEKFTEGLLKYSAVSGVSAFALGYLLSGIDLENLAVGIVGAVQGLPGVSLGTVIGSAIFLLLFAVGATALLHPLESKTPRRLIVMTLLSPIPLAALSLDGVLSRIDGGVLLAVSLVLIAYVLRTAHRHPLYAAKEKKQTKPEWAMSRARWWPAFLIVGGAVAILVGAEMFNWSIKRVLAAVELDGTTVGMLAVAAAVSFEEVPRMLAPARRGRSDVSVGNILGTVLFLALFNAGVIALVRPLQVERAVLTFYWPALMIALVATSVFLWRGRVGRTEGGLLMAGYAVYVALGLMMGYQA